MPLRKVKTKKFRTKQEASKWALKEKKKLGPQNKMKWETNRIDGSQMMKWEAVIFRDIA